MSFIKRRLVRHLPQDLVGRWLQRIDVIRRPNNRLPASARGDDDRCAVGRPIRERPDWVAEILSPATESFDRGPKKDAYGLMGVGWLWLLDPDTRTVETFASVRSKMIAGPAFGASNQVSAPPFESLRLPLDSMFPSG